MVVAFVRSTCEDRDRQGRKHEGGSRNNADMASQEAPRTGENEIKAVKIQEFPKCVRGT